ncbi:hypothetical protein [Streptomyces sp. DSM 40750]|uniref:hypothetical protein n=1 Tax=Streptomyces sp. DSM 40750 TaxID=2801030 RepID=UPI00214ADA9D|nr:hypothetical protein [Streptomyces sp. DSM 40750]UUU28411.1 hypothetical protein JIX55_01230 [Streptomyces sp. DSM 40750]UUU28436.1 hypothetical protein JIX55_49515 [Streptomyces sp. DSM 40750]
MRTRHPRTGLPRARRRPGTSSGPLSAGLPVALEPPQGVTALLEHDHQARHVVEVAVEVDAALQLDGEADQGVVDTGDVAAVRHRRQVHRPQVGDPRGVEDQGAGALVQELGGDGAQDGRFVFSRTHAPICALAAAAAAGAGA